ncbi:MAG TPA: lipid A biosynthesis lauroyl acyltransferase [Stellaceae bacterium]|nr:lipid A biosynthesis lauroyl acyltransferase [Stellaceae bacterium]
MAERRRLADALEALGARLLFGLFALLPLDRASAVGGALGRWVGPHLGASKRAVVNLRRAMPELDEDAIARIIAGMWDNLGRVVAEYPHLREIDVFAPGGRVEVCGADIAFAQREAGRRTIFFSAHCGNWEIGALAATQAGFAVAQIYRAPNNPLIDNLIRAARGPDAGELIPKGRAAARRAIAALEEGRILAMLVDQKMNDGIAVPFFGRDAMTAPALARLARRYGCTVVPVRIERLEGARFRLVCEPPLPVPRTADAHADVLALMTAVNATIERWIRARPEQWLWVHRRWPD